MRSKTESQKPKGGCYLEDRRADKNACLIVDVTNWVWECEADLAVSVSGPVADLKDRSHIII
jgi:hypothetical protein